MSAAALGLAGALLSALALALLAATDPKRMQAGRRSRSTVWRKPAMAVAFAPGLGLAVIGEGVSFLIWIGATAVLGWALAALSNLRRPSAMRERSRTA